MRGRRCMMCTKMIGYFLMIATLVFIAEPVIGAADEPRQGGRVVISYGGGTPRHFNPAVQSGTSTAIVGTQIFASPLRYDANWNPQPYLAKSWKVSEDGRSVTLNLVEGATFHDGRPITSEDVAFSIMAVKKYHPFKSMFAPVERVDTPDPHTAIIRLSHPHPAILLAMSPALLPILPKHVYGDGQDLMTHPANLTPVGSGPFRLTQYAPGKTIVLKRNEHYFIQGRPYLDEIVIRLEEDPDAQMIDMERQEAHLMPIFADLSGLDRLSRNRHLIITHKGYEGLGPIGWLAFNLLRKPLDDKRVRQAIAYAIDSDFITGYLHKGRSRPAPGPISPDSPFFTPDIRTYPVDLKRANRLLDEAGYSKKQDGNRFSLTLDYIPVIPSQQRDVALYIKRQLAKVGIDVQVRRSEDFPEWAERIGNWDFDITMDGVYNWGDPVIGVHRTYLSDNIRKGVIWSNTQNYRNKRVDEILKQAGQEMDTEKRKALYREFQQIVTEELPVMWVNVLPYHTVYNAGLGNPPLSIWGVHSPFDELYWKEPPVKKYVSTPAVKDGDSPLKQTGVRTIDLIKEQGFFDAAETMKDPSKGFLDLEGSGRHVIGITDNGIVFLDNSGQMKKGMDMSSLLDLDGKRLLPQFLDAVKGKNDGFLVTRGAWPHPRTHKLGTMQAWCGRLTDEDMICVLEWE
jgi:peptide/nickel transport system substrate-binding protein